jgi:hypothetical protein
MDIQILVNGTVLLGELKTDNMHVASPGELTQYAAEIQAYRDAQQATKPVELKQCENNFLLLCEQLFGAKEKTGFTEIQDKLTAMLSTDPQTAMVLSLKLLSIDAQGKRFDQKWWDSCMWNADV